MPPDSGLSSTVSGYDAENTPSTSQLMTWLTPTCQSVVDSIVSRPKPQHRCRQCVQLRQTLFSHLFEMFSTRPAAKEVADVASHGAQHLLRICGQKLNGARIKIKHF